MSDIKTVLEKYLKQYGHFGLRRGFGEDVFKSACMLALRDEQNPPVDYNVLPDSMGVAKWLKIEDQLQIGSCGDARASAEEVAIKNETGETVQLSRMFAYLTAQKVDGIRGDSGSTIEGGAKASRLYGTCLETILPYPKAYDSRIPDECWPDAEKRKTRTAKRMESYDEVLRWLANGIGGVVIGIGWNGTCEPDGEGRITSYRSGGGGHALALLDFTRKHMEGNKPFIEMFNSWSQSWGFQGRAFIAPKVIQRWCDDETVIGYTDMDGDAIKPRGIVMGL